MIRVKLMAACLAGAIAGLGGGLYAHLTTYVEPAIFDVMLGVHSLAYGLIGGLGTAFGPLLGVVIDIGLLESTRWFAGYRMIVFGGLVAVLLIVRPRGLLDERLVHRIRRMVRPPATADARKRHCSRKGTVMIAARDLLLSLLVVMVSSGSGLAADVKAKAEVSCAATAKPLEYDCTIKLSDPRSGAALTGVDVTVGADMPSMPMAHNVKPVKAMPGSEPGTYRARIELEMHGDWAVKVDLAGPVRDRIVKSMRFEPKR